MVFNGGMNVHRNYGLCALLLATVLLAGCGIKPGHVEPPEGVDKTAFPKTYPAPDNH